MKFSYTLLKKLAPAVKSKKELIDKLNLHYFEAEDLTGDSLDIGVASNRFSDASSHLGIAREISAILGKEFKDQKSKSIKNSINSKFDVSVNERNLCQRASAWNFEDLKIKPSPKWMQDVLISCGLRPINNLVDITNYVMLEIGQPLHAFDSDKMEGRKLIIRKAKSGEHLETLDGKKFKLDKDVLVLSDNKDALDVAGIKGGKKAEIFKNTKNILLTACNFDGANIYKTSRRINLITDASIRFSHNLSSHLVEMGINRAAELIIELCGAKTGKLVDVNYGKPRKKIIKFDIERFNKLIGIDLDIKTIIKYLTLLGFKLINITESSKLTAKSSFLVEVPILRDDIEIFEDVAEEAIRLYGYNKLKSIPPRVHLIPSGFEDLITLKDKIRKILIGLGLSEVSNYSLISQKEGDQFVFGGELISLENPMSSDFYYLRPSLAIGFIKNADHNLKFQNEVKIFEIGKVFAQENKERAREFSVLGILWASKNKETLFKLRGLVEELFRKIGLVDYLIAEPEDKEGDWVKDFTNKYIESQKVLKIESSGKVIGYIGQIKNNLTDNKVNIFEIDLDVVLKLVVEEHEYKPLSKYPSTMRDISVLVDYNIKVGDIMQTIQEIDLKYIEDVDLIDEYEGGNLGNKRSLTFRIVFQAEDKTLTDKEVDLEMEKVIGTLKEEFRVEIR